MDGPEEPEPGDEFKGLLAHNGARVRTGPGGESYAVTPCENFKRPVTALADHRAGNHRLHGATVRQAGGVVEIETSRIPHPRIDHRSDVFGHQPATRSRHPFAGRADPAGCGSWLRARCMLCG